MQPRPGDERVDVVIVGPTHPHTGGIAQHNTRLALELLAVGVRVRIESWKAQYPKSSRNGLGTVPRDQPELPLVPDVVEKLAWYSPWSWIRLVGRIRRVPLTLFTVVSPLHAVIFAVPVLALTRLRRGAIVHNVVSHDPGRFDRLLMGWLLRRMSMIIVHSDEQRDRARELGVAESAIVVTPLPKPGFSLAPDEVIDPPSLRAEGSPLRLLFFGMVRHYKGLDLLLEALARVPGVSLTVAGHFWEPIDEYRRQIADLGLYDRVELIPGYVAAQDIAPLMRDADALALPYRSATASIVAEVGLAHRRPVIVSDVGTLSEAVTRTGAGIVVEPDDVDGLARAIRSLTDRAMLAALMRSVRKAPDPEVARWAAYTAAIADRVTS